MYSIHQFRLLEVVSDPAMNKSMMAPYRASPVNETTDNVVKN